MSQYTTLDLFSGIGGFALAGSALGLKTAAFVEIDDFCQRVLRKNFPNTPIYGDIKQFKYDKSVHGAIDIVCGGFPCQPFSIAGKMAGAADERSLWQEMYRVICDAKPRAILAENVYGLLSKKFELELETIFSDLESAGYQVQAYGIGAAGKGYPHKRQRVWFVGFANTNSERLFRGGATLQEPISEIQSEFARFSAHQIRAWNENLDTEPVLFRKNAGISPAMDKYTERRVKALGNSICPAVAYELLSAICHVLSQTDNKK